MYIKSVKKSNFHFSFITHPQFNPVTNQVHNRNHNQFEECCKAQAEDNRPGHRSPEIAFGNIGIKR